MSQTGGYIEPDRQSNVSSFYRGRKDSFDVLGDAADPTPRDHRADDQSSFFRGDQNRLSRGSTEMLASAGYNRTSFFDPGRSMPVRGGRDEEEGPGFTRGGGGYGNGAGYQHVEQPADEGWDVYNDFNNQGPRYSDAFGTGLPKMGQRDTGYQKLSVDTSSLRGGKAESEATNLAPGTELVTVPALGPDWKRTEIENMRSRTHRQEKYDERKQKLKAWWRDQRGCCGGIGTRKMFVAVLFVICCLVAIILAITIPRVPGFAFDSTNPISANNATDSDGNQIPSTFSRVPANFTFPALLNIQVNTGSNVIPLHIKHIDAQIFDLDTGHPVGNGSFKGVTIPAKKLRDINIPVVFSYIGVNQSDQTWLDFYNACRNHAFYPDGVRPGFKLRVSLMTSITGLIKKVTSSFSVSSVNCPFELPQNSV